MLSRNAFANGAAQRIGLIKIIANLLAIGLIGSISLPIASAQRKPQAGQSVPAAVAVMDEDQLVREISRVTERKRYLEKHGGVSEPETFIRELTEINGYLLTLNNYLAKLKAQKEQKEIADARELKEGIDGAFASLRTNAPQGTATKLSNEIIQLSVLPPQQLTLLRDTKPSGSREWSVFNAALDLRNERDRTQREAEAESQRDAERANLQEAERKKHEAVKLVREQEVKRFSTTGYGQEIRSACVATVERNGTIQDPLPSQKAAQKELERGLCTCMVSKFAVDPDKVNADERAMFDMIGSTQGKLRNATVATMWSTALLACSIGQ